MCRTVQVFGAFIATELQERHSAQFFGTGETILFTFSPKAHRFLWTGENDFILRCNDQELIVGSGGGYAILNVVTTSCMGVATWCL